MVLRREPFSVTGTYARARGSADILLNPVHQRLTSIVIATDMLTQAHHEKAKKHRS